MSAGPVVPGVPDHVVERDWNRVVRENLLTLNTLASYRPQSRVEAIAYDDMRRVIATFALEPAGPGAPRRLVVTVNLFEEGGTW